MAKEPKVQELPNQPKIESTPKVAGYPESGIRTSGIRTRGNGAATKGVTARGPMA